MIASYVLPLRWREPQPLEEITDYLRWLSTVVDVLVVDGSPEPVFDRHHEAWAGVVTHVPPDPDLRFVFGKVNGVMTGVRRAAHEAVVIADDDVRYDEQGLRRLVALLDEADVVRPQNFFDPLPWHARWDTARTLLNRAAKGDWPGTLGVRRSRLLGAGGYDGDVMFENFELVRTVVAAGGRAIAPLDLYVRRLPPTTGHFLSQRVRQAFDEFARPSVLVAWLGIAPTAVVLLVRGRWRVLLGAVAASVGVAEFGRRRAGGSSVFPASSSLLAPAWLAERAVCAWLAVWERLRYGGVRYGDVVIRRAATPRRELEARVRRATASKE